jgi:hypothetical protein
VIAYWPLLKEVDAAEVTVILDESDAVSASDAAMAAITPRNVDSIRNTERCKAACKRTPSGVPPKKCTTTSFCLRVEDRECLPKTVTISKTDVIYRYTRFRNSNEWTSNKMLVLGVIMVFGVHSSAFPSSTDGH